MLVPAGAAAAGAAGSNESTVMNGISHSYQMIRQKVRETSSSFYRLAISSGRTSVKVTRNDSLIEQISQSGIPTPHKSLRINRSLNIGFAFGPDYTDAGGITNDQMGNNIGITLGYYLTNKFRSILEFFIQINFTGHRVMVHLTSHGVISGSDGLLQIFCRPASDRIC